MQRQPVESEAVKSVGYDGRHQTLAVEFREGRLYEYLEVPERTYRELMEAESIGNFVATKIKPCFKFRRRGRRITASSPSSARRSPSRARR